LKIKLGLAIKIGTVTLNEAEAGAKAEEGSEAKLRLI
jgi:hypothetical protein